MEHPDDLYNQNTEKGYVKNNATYDVMNNNLNELNYLLNDLKSDMAVKKTMDKYFHEILVDIIKEMEKDKRDFYRKSVGLVSHDISEVIEDINDKINYYEETDIGKIDKDVLISLLNSYNSLLIDIVEKYKNLK